MRQLGIDLWSWWKTRHDVTARVQQYGEAVRDRLHSDFARAGVIYPPASLALLAFKQERRLDVYAANSQTAPYRFIRSYPILGTSGTLGPKLREGDRQVPEGLYRVENLNPNSRYHLAIRVNYPNAFDLENAAHEKRTNPGSDIMIHGSDRSVGCLAMGDQAAEDLFVLCALTGPSKVSLIFSPIDFRNGGHPSLPTSPAWVPGLYDSIKVALNTYPPSQANQ
jgi:hypothetical protein